LAAVFLRTGKLLDSAENPANKGGRSLQAVYPVDTQERVKPVSAKRKFRLRHWCLSVAFCTVSWHEFRLQNGGAALSSKEAVSFTIDLAKTYT
jgi:hypothetical protein